MRRYAQVVEERVRVQAVVREWTRSGFLEASQSARLEAELGVDVRRTNHFLRAGLALFTGLIVGAAVLLVIEGWTLRGEIPIAAVTGAAAVVSIGLAEGLVGRFRFYRFGVEEALAVASVVLLGTSGASLASMYHGDRLRDASMIVGLLIGAAGGLGIYLRFGFVYAAVGSMVCAAAIPFELNLPPTTEHLLAAVTLASVFVLVRSKRLRYGDEYPGDDYGQLQAAAWVGLYVVLNLQLIFAQWEKGVFYWFTYVMTWLLPIAGLRLGIRGKDRSLIDVSLVLALVTLATNKPYLGWPRHTWDPILLGVVLVAAAIATRRWLSNGPGGERKGFTPARLISKDSAVLTLLSAASATVQPSVPASRPDPDPGPSGFDGGRSGGGGGGATY